jgi:hypothetical protein
MSDYDSERLRREVLAEIQDNPDWIPVLCRVLQELRNRRGDGFFLLFRLKLNSGPSVEVSPGDLDQADGQALVELMSDPIQGVGRIMKMLFVEQHHYFPGTRVGVRCFDGVPDVVVSVP